MKISHSKHFRVSFGTNCEVHDDPEITNTIKDCTHKGTAIGPTGNFKVSYKFFCLYQGKFITRRQFTKMEMPERIIKRINRRGKKSKREVFGCDLTFHEWDGDDNNLKKPSYQQHPGIAAEFPGVVLQRDQVSPIPAIEEIIQDEISSRWRQSQIHLSQEWIPQRRANVDHGLTWSSTCPLP